MKKLKIILPIFLISLFVFIGNVKADTVLNSVQYPVVESYLANNSGKSFEDFRNLVMSKIPKPDDFEDYDNYVVYIGYNYRNNVVYPYFILSNNFAFANRYNSLLLRIGTSPNAKGYGGSCVLKFNSDYTDLSWVQSSNLTTSCDNLFIQQIASLYDRNILSSDPPSSRPELWNMIIASNVDSLNYSYSGYNTTTFNINGNIYPFNSTIPFNNISSYTLSNFNYYFDPLPIIQPPYNIYKNGYTETTFIINNYTEESNVNGYFIQIINNNNGNIEGIAPDYGNPDREITLTSYENTNYTIQIHDREYNIIEEYSINANVYYENNTNFSIDITNIDNSTREVFYKYIISNSDQNYTCYHSINNNAFIQDIDCTDTSTVYYNLTMPNNGNLAFKIEDANNNIVYEYDQNIVFNVSETYISFQDNFDNNYLNLNVLINRYEANDIVEYSINNSSFIQTTLTDYSITQNIKNFYINNLNNNDILIVRVKRNNEIITYAKYKANYLKYYNNSEENYDISNIFEKINIENINNELKEYIKNFGNLIINSKIGNLLLLQTFCLVIILIIKMIRN